MVDKKRLQVLYTIPLIVAKHFFAWRGAEVMCGSCDSEVVESSAGGDVSTHVLNAIPFTVTRHGSWAGWLVTVVWCVTVTVGIVEDDLGSLTWA